MGCEIRLAFHPDPAPHLRKDLFCASLDGPSARACGFPKPLALLCTWHASFHGRVTDPLQKMYGIHDGVDGRKTLSLVCVWHFARRVD